MARGPVNRHQGLREGELTRRYRRRHDDVEIEDDAYDWLIDDYWDPWNESTSLDFQLHSIWQEILTIGYTPSFEAVFPQGMVGNRPLAPALAERTVIAPDQLADALYGHLQLVVARANRREYAEAAQLVGRFDEVRSALRTFPELVRWFEDRRGPGIMLLVLAPFWIRSLESWACPSRAQDLDATTVSLIDHLFVRYPIPAPLYEPWRSEHLPSLKWACWLLLIGQGASLPRAAARFGWSVSTKLVHHLSSAPADLEALEAVMWAEITRLGGSRVELDRVRQHPAYVLDPTAITGEPERFTLEDDDEHGDRRLRAGAESHVGFWQSTIEWLTRHRDELTDETCQVILDWAMHRHTEDIARDVAAPNRFGWAGRTPARALEQAREYRQYLTPGWRPDPHLTWKQHGWDWEERIGEQVWSVRELTSAGELGAESAAMSHCVASYVYRCAQQRSAIFSVELDGARRCTVELDPITRRVVQARGKRNRACDAEESRLITRWLAALAQRQGSLAPI